MYFRSLELYEEEDNLKDNSPKPKNRELLRIITNSRIFFLLQNFHLDACLLFFIAAPT